jgi:hypothetical protein
MHTTFVFRRTSALLLIAGALAAAAPSHAVFAQDEDTGQEESIPTGADEAALHVRDQPRADRRAARGQDAVNGLGNAWGKIARDTGMTVDQVKQMFLEDETLELTEDGTIQAADTLGDGGTGATITTGSSTALIWPLAETLTRHSRPSSPLKIYLDFTGHTTTGTAWNTETGFAWFTTPVWGRDGDSTTFSPAEAAEIQQAFASVAEDFAPFNVDVTTQDPGVEGLRRTSSTDAYYGIRVVIGENTWYNVQNSGYAKFYSFSWATDTPAYCFTTPTTSTKQIAECISHEVGHTVGLKHDGHTSGLTYYAGHANWAPIMGDSYSKAITQWSRGQYPGANNGEDDLAIIASYLGWVPDDYVGTTATTATLSAGTTRGGAVSWGVGEYDAFKFSLTGTRNVNIQSWEWAHWVDSNLNMRVQLTNAAGTVIAASSPTGTTRTNMTVTLGAGTYYVFIDGVGEGTTTTGYTNYGSLGFYNILLQFV